VIGNRKTEDYHLTKKISKKDRETVMEFLHHHSAQNLEENGAENETEKRLRRQKNSYMNSLTKKTTMAVTGPKQA